MNRTAVIRLLLLSVSSLPATCDEDMSLVLVATVAALILHLTMLLMVKAAGNARWNKVACCEAATRDQELAGLNLQCMLLLVAQPWKQECQLLFYQKAPAVAAVLPCSAPSNDPEEGSGWKQW